MERELQMKKVNIKDREKYIRDSCLTVKSLLNLTKAYLERS